MQDLIKTVGIKTFVLLIALVVIILFSAAFILLAAFYYKAKKKNIEHGLDDEEIRGDAGRFIFKRLKKNKSCKKEDILHDVHQSKKMNKNLNIVSNLVTACSMIFFIVMIGVALSFRSSGQQIFINDEAMLIIQTDSMATAYKENEYLKDENGNFNSKDRIKQYSYITISRKKEHIDNIKPFDVVAFNIPKTNNGGGYLTIVHRLINVEYDEDNNPLYTFRGDANRSSLTGEIRVDKSTIVGVHYSEQYHGSKNLAYGVLISYLQSNIGVILVVVAFVLVGIYSFYIEKLHPLYTDRFEYILITDIHSLVDEQKAKYQSLESKKKNET